ncbi:hypothetical protein Y1Q_0001791 [Alligator mississippiensis]|uniref:Uncharacterized protein n=1 Tax=Alligator mississippiensis TaxID=8496 RepID=A0A151MKV1_ALLMI|nr:hypothetical protein Y1Q_0001791 [Alligator mississippiensis]
MGPKRRGFYSWLYCWFAGDLGYHARWWPGTCPQPRTPARTTAEHCRDMRRKQRCSRETLMGALVEMA